MKLKKDKYRKKKGGKVTVYNISCGKCGEHLFVYQKDGPGNLFRCYFNRILEPETYSLMLPDATRNKANDYPNLQCSACNEVIGVPIKRYDGRIAFRLKLGYFHKKRRKG